MITQQVWRINNFGKGVINGSQDFYRISQDIFTSDIFVTGGTYFAGTAVFTNNTGGTFSVSGFSTSNNSEFTGGTVSGSTVFTNGLTANTFSATTYQNLPFSGNVIGTGTTGYIPKFNTGNTIDDSVIFQSGSSIGIGVTNAAAKLDVNGDIKSDSYFIPTTSTGGANIGTFEGGNRVYRMLSTGDYGVRQFELTPDAYRLLIANEDFSNVNEIRLDLNSYLLTLRNEDYENRLDIQNDRHIYSISDNINGKVNNITLNSQGVSTQGYVNFNTGYEITGTEPQASVYWNSNRETLQLKMNGTNYDYGMSLYFYVKNQTGEAFNKGDVIGFGGTLGASEIILGVKYVNDGSEPSDRLMGVCNERIEDGEEGKVVFFGEIKDVDTSDFADGNILYASNSIAGSLTKNEPNAGTNKGEIAAVVHAASNGTIFVRALTSKSLREIDDIEINSPVNGQSLVYESGIWVNKSNLLGTTGYLPKFNTGNTIDDSVIFQSGSSIGIGTSLPTVRLDVSGSTNISGDLTIGGNIIKTKKIITGTTYTLVNEDRNKILHFTSNSDVTVTIPLGLNSDNRYEGKQLGTGQVIFGTDIGVTLRVGASEVNKTAEQYSVFGLDVIGTEEYMLYGKLELV
jgi:hypothetical protein